MQTNLTPSTEEIEDAPNLREAGVSVCANCLHVLKNEDDGEDSFYCTAYDGAVDPGWVCDSWQMDADDEDGYKKKNVIATDATDFPRQGDDHAISLRNSNYPQFDYEYAAALKEEYPSIWGKGGNIRGNTAYTLWGRARDGESTDGVLSWIKEREAWAARHEGDFRIAGVIACVKWGVVVSRGEGYMKDLINEEKRKVDGSDAIAVAHAKHPAKDFLPSVDGFPALSVGTPSTEDLAMINAVRPMGMDAIAADEVFVLPVLASHNLMSHSRGIWDAGSLLAMAQDFPGKPLQLNHDWDSVESTVGFVYGAHLVQVDGDRTPSKVLNTYKEINSLILQQQDFIGLILLLALEATHPIVQAIKFKRVSDVSTGGLTNGVFWCPTCDNDLSSDACPHLIDYGLSAEEKRQAIAQGYQFTPYYIRMGFQTAIELSFVLTGNLPGAGIIGESMLSEMLNTTTDRRLRMRICDRSKRSAQ